MMRAFTGLLLVLLAFPLTAQACEGRLIEHEKVYGSPICLPESPKRIVILDAAAGLGVGLDIGLPIVGAPLDRMSDKILNERAVEAGITSIGFVTEPSLETVVALQPDLIIGAVGSESMASGVYPMVSQLAPTLLYASGDWRSLYHLLAPFTGKQEEVAKAFEEYDARVEDLKSRMPDVTVSVLRITSWDFQVYLDGPRTYAPFKILADAGVKRTPYETTDDPSTGMKWPDWEQLAQLDGDVLLYIVGGTNNSDKDGRHEEVLANPLWQMLPAVKSGKVHRIDHGHWMQFSGLPSAHRVLDDIERYVIGSK